MASVRIIFIDMFVELELKNAISPSSTPSALLQKE